MKTVTRYVVSLVLVGLTIGPMLPGTNPPAAAQPGIYVDSGQNLGSSWSEAVALGDLDGDGDLDAFVANGGTNEVWLNNGTGFFGDSGQSLGDATSNSVTLGDLDSDGDLDSFVGNVGANKVWLNDGAMQGGTPGDVYRQRAEPE